MEHVKFNAKNGRLLAETFDQSNPPPFVQLPTFSEAVKIKYPGIGLSSVMDFSSMTLTQESIEIRWKVICSSDRKHLVSRVFLKSEPENDWVKI
jgi:hypothetical protein